MFGLMEQKAKQEQNFADDYRRDGVVLIKGVFTKQDAAAIRSASYVALTKVPEIVEAGYTAGPPLEVTSRSGEPSPALMFWPALASPTLLRYRSDPRLATIVRAVVGDNVKQLNNQVYYRLPGDGDSFSWHQDIMFRSPREDYPNIVENDAYLQTAIIVDEMRRENGGVEYVLGSHKLGDLELIESGNFTALRGFDRHRNASKFNHLPTAIFDADPGDVLIWSSLIVHGSEPNSSERHRMYYMNGFADAGSAKPWPWYLRNGEVQPIDPALFPPK